MKMDCKNQPPPSVIEALMGLNTRPVQKRQRQRVLSENYMQKTSSLHFSHKSLRSQTRASATAVQLDVTVSAPTVSFVDQFCNVDHQICRSDTKLPSGLRDSQDTSLHPHHSGEIKPQNCPKFENRLETKLSLDAMKSHHKRKHIPFKPSGGRFSVMKVKRAVQDFTSETANTKLDASKISESSVHFHPDNRIRKVENLCIAAPAKRNWILGHRSLIRPRAHWDTSWYLISEEANKTTTSNPRLHITECNGSSLPCNSEPFSTNLESTPNVMSKNDSRKVSLFNKSKTSGSEQNVSDGGRGVYKTLYEPSSCLDFSRLRGCEIGLANETLAAQDDHTYGSGATQIGHLACDDDDDIFQDASQSVSDLASCPTPEPLSPKSSESEEVSRYSPISVLESISKGGVPSTMDCFMNGSTDLYEVYSEGLGMTVSSDEDNREESMDAIEVEDTAELSDRSYLVSVLGEACGFDSLNYSKWHSFENPITPLVFQILEERYGRHVSWPRSERKLLFDRINLGLTDTAKSCFSIRQISSPLRQRFFPCWTRKEIEENLWRLLITQDKEATKTIDTKPFKGKKTTPKKIKKSNDITCKGGIKVSEGDSSFIELEDYMDEIIIDIERSLLDDLLSECLSLQ